MNDKAIPASRIARRCLFAALLASTALATSQLRADDIWQGTNDDYDDPANWIGGTVPGAGETATFDGGGTAVLITDVTEVEAFEFLGAAAPFTITNGAVVTGGYGLIFDDGGAGIGGIISDSISDQTFINNRIMEFRGATSADGGAGTGDVIIENNNTLNFVGNSGAGSALITNNSGLSFLGSSSADAAEITNNGVMTIGGAASGGTATYIGGDAAAVLDISLLTAPSTSIGSIQELGTIRLGDNRLVVGGNNQNRTFGGTIEDGGLGGGVGGELYKVGSGTLTLSGALSGSFNYTGLTTLAEGRIVVNYASLGDVLIDNADSMLILYDDDYDAGLRPGSTLEILNGEASFEGNSSAGEALIQNRDRLTFRGGSRAGTSTIVMNSGGLTARTSFRDSSSADGADITVGFGTELDFYHNSTAGDATITSSGSIFFYADSTAGTADVTSTGPMSFYGDSSADQAEIVNQGGLSFFEDAVAGTATINNGASGTIEFDDHASADAATINNSGAVIFRTQADGGTAKLTNLAATADIDISDINSGLFQTGSVAGSGFVSLGGTQLWVGVGGDNPDMVFSGTIRDGGTGGGTGGSLVKDGTGTMVLSGINTYTGGTFVLAGELVVDGSIASSSVASFGSGTRLSGSGFVGYTQIPDGATLVGVQGQTLTMASLDLYAGSIVDVSLGAPGTTALFDVTGDLMLDGTLNVTDAGGFGPGLYRLFDYGGTLTDNTLEIGAVPGGVDAADLEVQTAVAGQVNLVNSAYVGDLLFWDGDAVGNADNGAIDGGDGVWTLVSTNWTNTDGSVNGAMTPVPGYVIFSGAPGTVTADDTAGALSVTGMQFATDGYLLTGDAIELVGSGGEAIIRVGDGTSAGEYMTATIASDLTGSAGLVKTDLGTLILSGSLDHTGLTTLADGHIVVDGTGIGDVMINNAGSTLTLSGAGVLHAGSTLGIQNGEAIFEGTYSAGDATTTIQNGDLLTFRDDSGAGTSTIVMNGAGTQTDFRNFSSAEGASITVGFDTELSFFNDSTAGDATITSLGDISFWTNSTAGTADITLFGSGGMIFYNNSSADQAEIDNQGGLSFLDNSVAGTAIIDNAGDLEFSSYASADAATINNSGLVRFGGWSTGGTAELTNLTATADIDISQLVDVSPLIESLAVGSIAGGGFVSLGDNQLVVGGNYLSTTFSGVIRDGGIDPATGGSLAKVGAGTLTLSGINTYTGATDVLGGELVVDGSIASSSLTTVASGAALSGGGVVGDTVIASGGHLIGAQGQTLTMASLDLDSGSIVDVSLGAPGTTALFDVTGDLTLDGTLNVADAGGFGPGLYRLMDYGGTLTDNTLDIGAVPGGIDPADLEVQAGVVSGQVNLVNSAYVGDLLFWDGDAPGNADNGLIDGGSGVWTPTSPNWTGADGSVNGAMTPVPGYVIFSGAAGTVTADDSAGALSVTGMQFATDGYVLTGDAIDLAGSEALIRVGDGTADGAGYTATIASNLTGGGKLIKTDLGTLILTGNNTYTGGTQIAGGTLQVSQDANLGDAAGGLGLASGTLAVTGSFDTARNVALSPGGRFDIAGGVVFGVDGVVSGVGPLVKDGAGTMVLSGTNTYFGGTQIDAGVLQVTADANLGNASGGVTFNGGVLATTGSFASSRDMALLADGVFDVAASTTLDLDGVIAGAGDLVKRGGGTLVLTGANGYGDTTVEAGTLVGDSSSISGDIANAGTVIFSQTTDATFAGDIVGLGSTDGVMIKDGAGALTLAGTSALDWTIGGGSVVAAAERFGGDATLETGGELVFDQTADASSDILLSGDGTGTFTKTGAGLLKLTSDNSAYAGHTDIDGGALDVANALGGSLAVNTGGMLIGGGTVGDTVVGNGGVISPGDAGQIGTLTVDGDLTLEAGSTYIAHVEAPDQSDLISVTGTATIDGGAVQIEKLSAETSYLNGQTYRLLTAGSLVDNAEFTFNQPFLFLDAELIYGTDLVAGTEFVDLSLSRSASFTDAALTFNQFQAAGALDGLEQSGDALAVFNELLVMTDADEARRAYDLTSGEIHASGQHVINQTFALFNRTLRQQASAGIGNGMVGAGVVSATITNVSAYGPTASASLGVHAIDAATGDYADARVRGAWAAPLGARGTIDSDGNAGALDWWTAGIAGGYEGVVDVGSGNAVAGLAFGYLRSGGTVDARLSSMDADGFHLGAYGAWTNGPWSLAGSAAYAASSISTHRQIIVGGINRTAEADYWNHTIGLSTELAYAFEMNSGFTISPLFTLDAGWSGNGGYSETGAGALGLTSTGQGYGWLDTGLGIALAHTIDTGNGKVTFDGRAVWEHAFAGTVPGADHLLAGSPVDFTVDGPDAGRDRLRLGAGLAFEIGNDMTIRARYDGLFSGNQQSHAGSVGLNVKF
jgi:outer membrane autotransporter protein